MELATKLNLTDHTLGMKVDNSGLAQFLFGWKQNSAVNAQVGTSVYIADVAKGGFPLHRLPLSFQFDMQY